jgi:hypothetical protein
VEKKRREKTKREKKLIPTYTIFLKKISTIIEIGDVFVSTLIRHPYMSQYLSLFVFKNTYPYLNRIISSFAFGNTEKVV